MAKMMLSLTFRPAEDEAFALEILRLVDHLSRARDPKAARSVGAAADDFYRKAFLDRTERGRKGHFGEQRVARHHVAHAGAAALGGQDAGDVDAGLLEVALVEGHRIGRAVKQRCVMCDDQIFGASRSRRGETDSSQDERAQLCLQRTHEFPPRNKVDQHAEGDQFILL